MSNRKAINWIKQYSKKQSLKMWILILSNIFFSLLSIAFAGAVKIIIDGATSPDIKTGKSQILYGAIGIFVIVLLQVAFRIIINFLIEHIKGRLEIEYRSHLYGSILGKKYKKITEYHSGELMNRIQSDVSVISDAVTTVVPNFIAAIARLICAVIAIVILDWIFATVFIVAGILVFITLTLMRGKLKVLHKDVQKTGGKLHSFMQECIENLLAIKVFSVNKKISDKADGLQEENFNAKIKRAKYSVGGHAVYNMIFSLGYIFALIYGAVKIYNGMLGYGSLSAILQLVNNVQVPFASLSSIFPKYYAMVASAERIMEIEEIDGEISDKNFESAKVYEKLKSFSLESVTFSYDREVVLDNANLIINKGDFVMIEGVSGIGKSTLIKLLLGVYVADSGKILANCDGQNYELSEHTRTLFSYVPQQNMLFSGSIYDNLTFIKSNATDEQIEHALRVSCADEFISALPDGINTKVGENGLGLSEGQIQRIAIARAVLAGAPVLLLDESTSALDEKTERKLLNNLKKLENKTLIIVSHKNAAREICNRIVRIQDKKITE